MMTEGSHERHNPTDRAGRTGGQTGEEQPMMRLQEALEIVDDELPDGAWMQALCDMTGLDAGDVSAALAKLPGSTPVAQPTEAQQQKRKRSNAQRAARRRRARARKRERKANTHA